MREQDYENKCSICHKLFSTKSGKYTCSHNENPPAKNFSITLGAVHACLICTRRFNTPKDLIQHIGEHSIPLQRRLGSIIPPVLIPKIEKYYAKWKNKVQVKAIDVDFDPKFYNTLVKKQLQFLTVRSIDSLLDTCLKRKMKNN